MLSKSSSVSRRNACRRLSLKSRRLRAGALQLAQIQPLAGEIGQPALPSRGSASMRRVCCRAPAVHAACSDAPDRRSSSSGMLLHRKKDRREASSRSLTAVDAARGDACRLLLEAEDEPRIDQHARQSRFDARARKLPSLRASLIEAQQRFEIRVANAAGDKPRARAWTRSVWRRRLILVRRTGWHTKILRRLGVSPGAGGIQRTGDRDTAARPSCRRRSPDSRPRLRDCVRA